MSKWEQHGMSERVQAALEAVHLNNPNGHPFGRPYVSSYQIAIALVAQDPQLTSALGKELGGTGIGSHTSLAQYIGNELSKQTASGNHPNCRRRVHVKRARTVDRVPRRRRP